MARKPKPTVKPVKPEKRGTTVGKPAARVPNSGRVLKGQAAKRQLKFEKLKDTQIAARKKRLGM